MIPANKREADFIHSAEGREIRTQLERMASDTSYNTSPSYNSNTEVYTDNLISFVDKHMVYLSKHPQVNPGLYVSNLRLKTRHLRPMARHK